jgi:periplasmic copper chaperone A
MRRTVSRMLARATAVLAAVLVSLVALAAAASAHVSVSSADAAPGGFGKLTFRVPNESDTASTVGLRIQIPEEAALASMSVLPVDGWKVTTTTSNLPEPAQTDEGQEISTYVSVVEFRAEDGGGIAPGEFQEFSLSGGPFPDVDTVSFPTVQTYSDGTESAWIEPTVGDQEPEFPAPTLSLTAAASEAGPAADPATSTDDGGNGTAVTALVVSLVALVAGLAALALGWMARRRTVSS